MLDQPFCRRWAKVYTAVHLRVVPSFLDLLRTTLRVVCVCFPSSVSLPYPPACNVRTSASTARFCRKASVTSTPCSWMSSTPSSSMWVQLLVLLSCCCAWCCAVATVDIAVVAGVLLSLLLCASRFRWAWGYRCYRCSCCCSCLVQPYLAVARLIAPEVLNGNDALGKQTTPSSYNPTPKLLTHS